MNETTSSAPVRGSHRFRVGWPALLSTGITLSGYTLCSIYEKSDAWRVGLGLLLAFGGFVGVSFAMILDSDNEDG